MIPILLSGDDEADDFGVGTFILALVLGIIARNILTRHIKIPYTVLILAFGLLFGWLIHGNHDALGEELGTSLSRWVNIKPSVVLYTLLPVLIFESSFSSDFHIFLRELWQVLVLAGPGVLLSTFLTGAIAKYIFDYEWSWYICLMFGAMLSATDPVAVVAILKDLGVSERLGTLIEGESLLNDGTAIVIFDVFHTAIIEDHTISAEGIIEDGLRLACGGPLVGMFVGYISAYVIGFILNDPISEITLTVVCCYTSFLVAEGTDLHTSGVLSVVFAGLFLSFYGRGRISPTSEHFLHSFWEMMSYMANTVIFFASGLIMADKALSGDNIRFADWGYLVILYFCCQIIRVINVVCCYPVLKRGGYGITFEQLLVLAWSGLRGAVGLTLALIVNDSHVDADSDLDETTRDRILFHTAGIAMLTLCINGTSARFLIHYLELDRSTRASTELFIHTCSVLENKLEDVMHMLKLDRFLADADWATVWRYIPIYTSRVYWSRIKEGYIKLSDLESDHILRRKIVCDDDCEGDFVTLKKLLAGNSNIAMKKALAFYSHLPPRLRSTWFRYHETFHVDNFEEVSEIIETNKLCEDTKPQSLFLDQLEPPQTSRNITTQAKEISVDRSPRLTPRRGSIDSVFDERRPSKPKRPSTKLGNVVHGHQRTIDLNELQSQNSVKEIPVINPNRSPLSPVKTRKPFGRTNDNNKEGKTKQKKEEEKYSNNDNNNNNNNNNKDKKNQAVTTLDLSKLKKTELNWELTDEYGGTPNTYESYDSDDDFYSDHGSHSTRSRGSSFSGDEDDGYNSFYNYKNSFSSDAMMAPLMTDEEIKSNPTAMLMTCLTLENEKDLRNLAKTSGGIFATEGSMIKEARVRFLMAIKAKYRSNHKRGWLSATGLRVLLENVDVQLDRDGEQLHDWDHLAEHYSIPARLMSKLTRWRNYPIASWFVESYIHKKLSFVFELASNFIYAHDEVDILEFMDEGEVANKLAGEHLEQLNKARKTLREQLPVFPEIARALKTQVATRFMLVKHREITEELMTHGILTEKESEMMIHENTKSMVKLQDHPYSEHLPPREHLLEKVSFLRYLSSKERSKVVNDEKICQEEFHGSNILLMKSGADHLNAATRERSQGFYVIIRGTVLSGIDEMDNNMSDNNLVGAAEYLNAGQIFGFTEQILQQPFHATYLTASFVHLFYFDRIELMKAADRDPILKKGIWWSVAMDIAHKIQAFRKLSRKVMQKLMADARFIEIRSMVSRKGDQPLKRLSITENKSAKDFVELVKNSLKVNGSSSPSNQEERSSTPKGLRKSLSLPMNHSFHEDIEDRVALRQHSMDLDNDSKMLILNTGDGTVLDEDEIGDENGSDDDDYDLNIEIDDDTFERKDGDDYWECHITDQENKRVWKRKDNYVHHHKHQPSGRDSHGANTHTESYPPTASIWIDHGNQILLLKGGLRYRAATDKYGAINACSAPALVKRVDGPVMFTPGSKIFIIPAVMVARDNSAHQMLMHSINRRTLLKEIRKDTSFQRSLLDYKGNKLQKSMHKNLSRFLKSRRDLVMARSQPGAENSHQNVGSSFIARRFHGTDGKQFVKMEAVGANPSLDSKERSQSIDNETSPDKIKDYRRSLSESTIGLGGSMTNLLSWVIGKDDVDGKRDHFKKKKNKSIGLFGFRRSSKGLQMTEIKEEGEENDEGEEKTMDEENKSKDEDNEKSSEEIDNESDGKLIDEDDILITINSK